MVTKLFASLLLVATLTACVSKSRARVESQKAFLEGQRQALIEQQQKPAVWFRGDVRNPRVQWIEGMTLAQGILAAQYTGSWDPRAISVIREGQVHAVDPRRLLRGQEDPLLEPGDIVEVRR